MSRRPTVTGDQFETGTLFTDTPSGKPVRVWRAGPESSRYRGQRVYNICVGNAGNPGRGLDFDVEGMCFSPGDVTWWVITEAELDVLLAEKVPSL